MTTALLGHSEVDVGANTQDCGHGEGLRLRCPVCSFQFQSTDFSRSPNPMTCHACGFPLQNGQGVWKALAPARESRFRQFISDYERVRAHEGRGSQSCHYYLSLPFRDTTGRNAWQWKIRGRSYHYLEKRVLPGLERSQRTAFDVLDVGAGNCWLSYRLALRGHRPVAIDLLLNDWDGLGAARHYLPFVKRPFLRFQAEMDRLPFDDRQFDLIVFNASFHYSEDYERTLKEAVRCLRPSGAVLIIDSPFYEREESGRQMVEERHAAFQKLHGIRSDSLASQEFLTPRRLDDLGKTSGIQWRVVEPWYGLSWMMRPWRAKLLRRRDPAKFLIAVGTLGAP
jgi:SAM-dependent methyltransferase/ribosomal protein S27E